MKKKPTDKYRIKLGTVTIDRVNDLESQLANEKAGSAVLRLALEEINQFAFHRDNCELNCNLCPPHAKNRSCTCGFTCASSYVRIATTNDCDKACMDVLQAAIMFRRSESIENPIVKAKVLQELFDTVDILVGKEEG